MYKISGPALTVDFLDRHPYIEHVAAPNNNRNKYMILQNKNIIFNCGIHKTAYGIYRQYCVRCLHLVVLHCIFHCPRSQSFS